jgi:hypothetical protein
LWFILGRKLRLKQEHFHTPQEKKKEEDKMMMMMMITDDDEVL